MHPLCYFAPLRDKGPKTFLLHFWFANRQYYIRYIMTLNLHHVFEFIAL